MSADALKMDSLALHIFRFLYKTFSKLLKLILQNTFLRGWFSKNLNIQVKNL